MTTSRSMSASHGSTAPASVSGLMARPTCRSRARTAAITGVGVLDGLEVEHDQVASSGREPFEVAQRLGNHQVGVERQRTARADGGHHCRAKGDVVDEVTVHDVEVDRVHPGRGRPDDLRPELGEISVQDAGRDLGATGHHRASTSGTDSSSNC